MPNIPKLIILHHSLTKDSGSVSWGAIRRYHVQTLGWRDIGYHYGIELATIDPQTTAFEILVGRMPDEIGAHTTGHNAESIGICFVGDFDTSPVPPKQWAAGVRLVRFLLRQYAIPIADVRGHRDFAPKTCPGKQFDLDKFRHELGLIT